MESIGNGSKSPILVNWGDWCCMVDQVLGEGYQADLVRLEMKVQLAGPRTPWGDLAKTLVEDYGKSIDVLLRLTTGLDIEVTVLKVGDGWLHVKNPDKGDFWVNMNAIVTLEILGTLPVASRDDD